MKKLKIFTTAMLTMFCLHLSADLNLNTAQNKVNGDSITVYENFTPTGYNIFASLQNSGTWLSSAPLADPLTSPTTPFAAINSTNQVAAIWLGYDLFTYNPSLYGSFYVSGTWVTSQISDPTQEYVTGNYQIKLADDGTSVVTWAGYQFGSGTNEARGSMSSTFGVFGTAFTIP